MRAFRQALDEGVKPGRKWNRKTGLVRRRHGPDRAAAGNCKWFVPIVVLLSAAVIAFACFQMARDAEGGAASGSVRDTSAPVAADSSEGVGEVEAQERQHLDKDDGQLAPSEGGDGYQYTIVEGRDSGIISNG